MTLRSSDSDTIDRIAYEIADMITDGRLPAARARLLSLSRLDLACVAMRIGGALLAPAQREQVITSIIGEGR